MRQTREREKEGYMEVWAEKSMVVCVGWAEANVLAPRSESYIHRVSFGVSQR